MSNFLVNPDVEPSVKHTEESIIKILRNHYNQFNYRISNSFIYASDWESDFFAINKDGYAFEFEIKISRADFKNDFKKYKHMLFKKPDKHGILLPNKFYYVVPAGMVSQHDIPKYAGLIYVSGHAEIIKRAPFLHKVKRDYRRVLCNKFYNLYLSERREKATLKYDFGRLKKAYDTIKHFLPQEERQAFEFFIQSFSITD